MAGVHEDYSSKRFVRNCFWLCQGIHIINLLDAAIYFSQIISLLPHTNLTNLTKTASLKARSCRLCRRREMSVGCDDCRFIGIKECSLLLIASRRHIRAIAMYALRNLCNQCETKTLIILEKYIASSNRFIMRFPWYIPFFNSVLLLLLLLPRRKCKK